MDDWLGFDRTWQDIECDETILDAPKMDVVTVWPRAVEKEHKLQDQKGFNVRSRLSSGDGSFLSRCWHWMRTVLPNSTNVYENTNVFGSAPGEKNGDKTKR